MSLEKQIKESQSIHLMDNSHRAGLTIKVFWVIVVLAIIALIFDFIQLDLLQKLQNAEDVSDTRIDLNDISQRTIGIVTLIITIASIVLFLNWYRRAYENLQRLNIRTNHTGTHAVWSFFIPILNLFRPYSIVREILIETRKKLVILPTEHLSSPKTAIIGFWWAAFLISGFVGRIAFKVSLRAEDTIEGLTTTTYIFMVSEITDIIAAALAIVMIKQISKDETALYQNIHSLDTFGVPEKTLEYESEEDDSTPEMN